MASQDRASQVEDLLNAVQKLIIPFVRAADDEAAAKVTGHGLQQPGQGPRTALVEHHPPHKLQSLLDFELPNEPQGKDGLLTAVQKVLHYSVNTWDQGFLDKLYASITPVGLASDLVLSALNTNLHVYQVAPALITIEKHVGKVLAELFGFKGTYAGGVTQPGGSAANLSSIVIARNNLHPETKEHGNGNKEFVLFTSVHGHYSLEKAAQILGLGSGAVSSIAVDDEGCMKPEELEKAIEAAIDDGKTPLYVNATAGTTVLGSWDDLKRIGEICQRHNLWFHVDASWGGPVIFSKNHKHKLQGSHRANTIALCPHKMLNIPVTCTYLLGQDLRQFHRAMTLPAGYLFHNPDEVSNTAHEETDSGSTEDVKEVWDLADLTPQCGRRGDSLKLALSWIYYGTTGLGAYVDGAFAIAEYLAHAVVQSKNLNLVSTKSPPCLQVCFYYRQQDDPHVNSKTTEAITKSLVPKGFMIDFAPGEHGKFFRVVVNGQTRLATIDGLIKAIEHAGESLQA